MSTLQRTLRTSPVTGISVESILESVLVAELLTPSPEVWLVSPWISDVAVFDNSRGSYDGLLPDAAARTYTFSELLALLLRAGSRLTVVARPNPYNQVFLERLRHLSIPDRLTIIQHDDLHEKTLCGQDWVLTGSMNFTFRGMEVNDEALHYQVSVPAAAQVRLDLTHRWKGPS
jgi:phosphatidylserine/phosphatidylglycerophosphate/cardiolipin synthase-like enzyme